MRQSLPGLLVLVGVSSLSAWAQAPSEQERVNTIDAAVRQAMAKPFAVGLSVAVAHEGKLIFNRGYGLAEVEHGVAATSSTLFRIGSVTKQFTAAAILQQVDAGKLDLDAPLSEFVEFPTQGHVVTVRQLLSHTSGIPSYTSLGQAWVEKWPLELSDDELLGLVKGKPLDFAPGTEWAYSNTGYYLLGMILEKVCGSDYPTQVRALVEPLGLERTRYDSNRELIANRAQGYSVVAGRLANDAILGMRQPGAAGGLVSTAAELVAWSQALVSGKVVSKESYALMIEPTVLQDGSTNPYGLGLSNGSLEGRKRIQHGGGIMGFNSMLFWFPEERVHVAVISNSEALSSSRLADDVARAALGIERTPVLDTPIHAELRSLLTGNYTITPLGLKASVREEGEHLLLQPAGQGSFRLLRQGETLEFRASFDTEVKLVFSENGDAFVLHQGGQARRADRDPD